MAPEDQPPPAPSSQSSSTDDFCYVFLVELERGPSGLGMGLIDGMVSAPGQLLFWASVLFTKDGPTVQCVWSLGEEVGRPSKGLGQGAWWGHVWNLREMKGPRTGATSPTCCHFCPQTWGICPVGTVLVSTAVLADTMMTWARPGLLAEGGTEVTLLGPPECCGPQSPEASVSPSPQHTPLGTPGLYIQTLLPGSPAAADGRLSLGDQILEVNGSSLLGVSYLRYPNPSPPNTHTPRSVRARPTCRTSLAHADH